MIIQTRVKIAGARIMGGLVKAAFRLTGRPAETVARRGGCRWHLNIDEGIDLAIFLFGSFEPSTVTAYRKLLRGGETVLDIGANRGAHTLPLAMAVGPRGRVVACEPTQDAFKRLVKNIALNPSLGERIVPRQVLLSREDGAILPGAIYASWPLTQTNDSHPLHKGVRISTAGAEAVKLDTVARDLSLDRLDLVKMDVDGFEMEVLEGGRQTLEKFRPAVIFELSPYTLEERGLDGMGPVELLREMGYTFHDLAGRQLKDVPRPPPGSSINLLALSVREKTAQR